jgi:ATP-dependent DNA helicase RecG
MGRFFAFGWSVSGILFRMADAHDRSDGNPILLPLTELRGVGVERAGQLARLGLTTIGDLLLHRPRRYEDRRRFCGIDQLRSEEPACIRGQVVAQGLKRFRQGRQSVFECILEDGTARLHCRWWNQPFLQHQFHVGDQLVVFGKLVALKPRTMDHPEIEWIEHDDEASLHLNRIVPIYPLTEGVSQRWLRTLVWRGLEFCAAGVPEPWPSLALPDLPARFQALRDLHFPLELANAQRARERLALDEYIGLQWQIQKRRQNLQTRAAGRPCGGDNHLIRPFLKQLKFSLTEAQTKVLRELRWDMAGPYPMRRLLQGDVGSGKTVVAACTALMAIESGYAVALMAPTEVLAEQHFQTFRRWFQPLGIGVHLQTGSWKSPPVNAPGLVIGTHALIEPSFAMANLGLVIIDEQHKFGVSQREQLVQKGHFPHLLVMTATPIPRTLGLTLYGDLDCSVIDQMPPGRGHIRTFVRAADQLPRIWEFVRRQLAQGRQAYVVYPLIDEAENGQLKAVAAEYEILAARLAPFRLGLLHGRLKSEEKEQVLAAFRNNQCQVLLATTVIEVGLDVPNANLMLIENAEQFGLAQLHQLRGRIGRGTHDSFCILVARKSTPEARQRLQVLAETTDGFRIAEADLAMRGPGDFLGHDQSGLPPLRFGQLAGDMALIERARELASRLLSREPA